MLAATACFTFGGVFAYEWIFQRIELGGYNWQRDENGDLILNSQLLPIAAERWANLTKRSRDKAVAAQPDRRRLAAFSGSKYAGLVSSAEPTSNLATGDGGTPTDAQGRHLVYQNETDQPEQLAIAGVPGAMRGSQKMLEAEQQKQEQSGSKATTETIKAETNLDHMTFEP